MQVKTRPKSIPVKPIGTKVLEETRNQSLTPVPIKWDNSISKTMETRPMDHLHAYWRIEYIEAPKPTSGSDNFFSEIVNSKDEDTLVVFRSTHAFIMLNKYPYNAGHLLAAPFRSVQELKDLNDKEKLDFMTMIVKSQEILKSALKAEGFNIGFNIGKAAGAGVPNHIHCHIVPRWVGDTNFMPVLGNTKVLPQSLSAMWKRLRQFAD